MFTYSGYNKFSCIIYAQLRQATPLPPPFLQVVCMPMVVLQESTPGESSI